MVECSIFSDIQIRIGHLFQKIDVVYRHVPKLSTAYGGAYFLHNTVEWLRLLEIAKCL